MHWYLTPDLRISETNLSGLDSGLGDNDIVDPPVLNDGGPETLVLKGGGPGAPVLKGGGPEAPDNADNGDDVVLMTLKRRSMSSRRKIYLL